MRRVTKGGKVGGAYRGLVTSESWLAQRVEAHSLRGDAGVEEEGDALHGRCGPGTHRDDEGLLEASRAVLLHALDGCEKVREGHGRMHALDGHPRHGR